MPLGERARGRLRYGLDNPFTRNVDPTLVLDLPFSEGVGDTVHDRSLYGNHGTIYEASWVDGKIGKALSFDGVDDYVEVLHSPSLNITDVITAMCWIKTTASYPAGFHIGVIQKMDFGAPYHGKELGITNNHIYFHAGGFYAVNILDGALVINDGVWHHVVGGYDGANSFIYIDGSLDVSEPRTNNLDDNEENLDLARAYSEAPSHYFNGVIDEVRVYNRVLTAEEILRLYNEGK